MRPVLWALVGPTASGKTAVACRLAKKLPIEAVSCDSMQVYKRMPILTQAPTAAEKKTLKAHLVSFLEPSEEYNAALFRRDASAAIAKIVKKGKTPLLIGGTGLYVRTLLHGIFEHEDDKGQDEVLRKKLLKEEEGKGAGHLHKELKKIDPASAARIHPNDLRRLVRALEVFHSTGRPMSEQKPNRKGLLEEYDCRILFLDRDRQDLYARIEKRVDQMVKGGLLKEVSSLRKRKPGKTASMALGYREMSAVLDGASALPEAVELLKKNTRHYAKRQLSWFRHEKGVETVAVAEGESAESVAARIARMMK